MNYTQSLFWHDCQDSFLIDRAQIADTEKRQENAYGDTAVEFKLISGDFVLAQLLADKGFVWRARLIEHCVDAMVFGLTRSKEPARFRAFLYLMIKTGIPLSENAIGYMNTGMGDEKRVVAEIFGHLHELACEYSKNVSAHCDTFLAYATTLKQVLYALDRDFALAILGFTSTPPKKLKDSVTVFRGMSGPFSEKFIVALFHMGHQAYVRGKSALFSFGKNKTTNMEKKLWDYSGTYVSCFEEFAMVFADGITSLTENSDDQSLLLEIQLPKGFYKVCGEAATGELIVNRIEPEWIVAVYVCEQFLIKKVYKNPSLMKEPRFGVGDSIKGNLYTVHENDRNICLKENLRQYEPVDPFQLPLSVGESLEKLAIRYFNMSRINPSCAVNNPQRDECVRETTL